MTRLIIVAVVFAGTVCAQATQKKSDRTATTAAPAAVPSIPKDAVKNADGTWSYTDKQGGKWVYFTTPFGVMRTVVPSVESQPAPPSVAPTVGIKVIDKGDTVRFEQPIGPFGPVGWEKKKSDLTEQERQMVEAQQNQSPNQSQTQTAKPETK